MSAHGAESAGFAGAQWLANEQYALLITPAGAGFSAFEDCLLTVWRADPAETAYGVVLYVRDLETGEFWSACGQPLPGQAAGRVRREPAGIVIEREHAGIASQVLARLSGAAEVRACRLENRGSTPCRIEITSFVEVALDHPAGFDGHPAFSKLFVQTAWEAQQQILTASRRPRGHGDSWPHLAHALLDATVTDFLSDRPGFIGRGRNLDAPRALMDEKGLGRMHGNVLDPALSLRTVVEMEPGESRSMRFVLAVDREAGNLPARIQTLRAEPPSGLPAADDARAPAKVRPMWLDLAVGLQSRLTAEVRHRVKPPQASRTPQEVTPPRLFDNGFGGFSEDGREYRMHLARQPDGSLRLPPAPWTNVIANTELGFLVSEKGASSVWGRNSREHRITPWRNDAVVDPHCDAFYVRDEDTGEFWSPLPGPTPAGGDFDVRHGFGYSTWKHHRGELGHEVTLFVPEADPVHIARIRIGNMGTRRRRLALYAYNQWVLGSTPEATRPTVTTEFSSELQAVLARNPAAPISPNGIGFAACTRTPLDGWCTDRVAFLGSPGSAAAPEALVKGGALVATQASASSQGERLAQVVDPCAVLRAVIEIEPGRSHEIAFLLGEARNADHLGTLLARYREPGAVDATLEAVRRSWSEALAPLQVKTPSRAFDLMVNGWLPYQNLACRLRARTAFYQSGGAFGFRDQIQDASGLVFLNPELTRAQILLHAAHQFVEGDVLHWWHPPQDKGMRTRFADDLLWLPWIAAYYIRVTGDRAVLDERVPFVEARALAEGEDETYLQPRVSGQIADLYEHCCRAIDRSLKRGQHGLPLFGTGDWNDGMNRVGRQGRGESVWMGFFLHTVLGDFLPLCEQRGDSARVDRYRAHQESLRTALNEDGWDGEWYRRGWYDNGAVLGSKASDECRIDALAQAWSVISKTAPSARAAQALDSVERHLVDDGEKLIRLLTPPFVDTPNDPGYIKGYVAGVRENGGQYTHAAIWVVRAMAEAGRRDRAMQLFEGINPIHHSLDEEAADKYKVEPYVVAADIYGAEPHVGRGGWTWYTGSAGWMYRVAVETLLGFSIEEGRLVRLEPRVPDVWDGFQICYRAGDGTRLVLDVRNPQRQAARIAGATLDGEALELQAGVLRFAMPRTGKEHRIVVTLRD